MVGSTDNGWVLFFKDYNWPGPPTAQCGSLVKGTMDSRLADTGGGAGLPFAGCLAAETAPIAAVDMELRAQQPIVLVTSGQCLHETSPAILLTQLRKKYGPETHLVSPWDIVWIGKGADGDAPVQIEATIKTVNGFPDRLYLEVTLHPWVDPSAPKPKDVTPGNLQPAL